MVIAVGGMGFGSLDGGTTLGGELDRGRGEGVAPDGAFCSGGVTVCLEDPSTGDEGGVSTAAGAGMDMTGGERGREFPDEGDGFAGGKDGWAMPVGGEFDNGGEGGDTGRGETFEGDEGGKEFELDGGGEAA